MTEATQLRTPVQYQGHEVPWVTRWTGEVPEDGDRELSLSWDEHEQRVWLAHKDPTLGQREANGILWQGEGVTRGGRPEFSQVSVYRQRAAMRKRLCQVCGKKIEGKVINWLMAPGQLDFTETGESITMNAPTCDACIPIALDLCPHLYANGALLAHVLEYELWGVYGEAITVRIEPDGRPKFRRVNPINVPYDNDLPGIAKTGVLAKQQIVRLTKYTIGEIH